MPHIELEHSSYLDYNSFFDSGLSTGTPPSNTTSPSSNFTFNVALIFERASDPTSLLSSSWGARQKQLETYNDVSLWRAFGANEDNYRLAENFVNRPDQGVFTIDSLATPETPSGYVSSWQSRTLWVQVDAQGFQYLFGKELYQVTYHKNDSLWWEGNLGLHEELKQLGVVGLWFDSNAFGNVLPNATSTPPVSLSLGTQGTGNGAGPTAQTPQQIAEFYNLPLAGLNVQTPAIALIEPGMGDIAPQAGPTFAQLLGNYRAAIGLDPNVNVIGVQPGGPVPPGYTTSSERSLDAGIATAVNPQSTLLLYAGSGVNLSANSDPFTAYQAAIWDTVNNPRVISSSFRFQTDQPHGDSPFAKAAHELFIDAALRNISVFSSAGDGGSSYALGTGGTSVSNTRASPYGVVVGGTSLSTEQYALKDATLSAYVLGALQGDPATLWQLVEGGLTAMPVWGGDDDWFVEAVWNRYNVQSTPVGGPSGFVPGLMQPGYTQSESGNGGVDFTQPTPWYQSALMPFSPPTTSDGTHRTGRGVPDVSVLAGGNMWYLVPQEDMTGNPSGDGGTSAATPFWASLAVQVDTIFVDQGLPRLGYMTDLLYIAAAIAPGSFNDVTLGNNVSSFLTAAGNNSYLAPTDPVVPTGFGYYAGPGYDLTTGLGSPNGTLLARALTAIGHSQYFFDETPIVEGSASAGWTSGVEQSLMLQTMSGNGVTVGFSEGGDGSVFFSPGSASLAWTARLAGQVLQSDFDPNLVRLFDRAAQGTVSDTSLSAGEQLAVTIDGVSAQAWSAQLTDQFGFADFQTTQGALRVARPVAVAETARAADDTVAIVRVRQNGEDNVSLSFFRVDDLNGTIDGRAPDAAGYAALAQGRAYQLQSGGIALAGPGYGNFAQTGLINVDAGDFIAFKLVNTTSGNTFWGFAQANEMVNGKHVGHLWSFGLNTWGFEDTLGGGDHDFNDVVFSLDFTSASGSGWLVR